MRAHVLVRILLIQLPGPPHTCLQTRIGVAAVLINQLEGHGGSYVIVEPFPTRVPKHMPGSWKLLETFVEQVVHKCQPLASMRARVRVAHVVLFASVHFIRQQQPACGEASRGSPQQARQ